MGRPRIQTKILKSISLDDFTVDMLTKRFVDLAKLIRDNPQYLDLYVDTNYEKVQRDFQGSVHVTTTSITSEINDKIKQLKIKNFSDYVRFLVYEKFVRGAKAL